MNEIKVEIAGRSAEPKGIDSERGVVVPSELSSAALPERSVGVDSPARVSDLPSLSPSCCISHTEWKFILHQVNTVAKTLRDAGYAEATLLQYAMRELTRAVQGSDHNEHQALTQGLCRAWVALEKAEARLASRHEQGRMMFRSPDAAPSAAEQMQGRLNTVIDHLKNSMAADLRYLLTRDRNDLMAAGLHLEDGAMTLLVAGMQHTAAPSIAVSLDENPTPSTLSRGRLSPSERRARGAHLTLAS
jgi:hypothetical protein